METLAIVSLVGNVVQFVDFSSKLIAKSTELYRSSEGALAENIDAETAAKHLVLINNKIQATVTAVSDEALKRLCESCRTTADELLAALDKVKVNGKQGRWKSTRKALRSVWTKEKIRELEGRLAKFKEELNLHIVVDLRYVDIFLNQSLLTCSTGSGSYPLSQLTNITSKTVMWWDKKFSMLLSSSKTSFM